MARVPREREQEGAGLQAPCLCCLSVTYCTSSECTVVYSTEVWSVEVWTVEVYQGQLIR